MANKRVCSTCQQHLVRSCFTAEEWEDDATSRCCCVCIDNGEPSVLRNNSNNGAGFYDQQQDDTTVEVNNISARCNESSTALFTQDELSFPFAQGAFRWAAKGIYKDGPRKGQHCVCKWFKDGHVSQDEFYDLDIKAMYKALDLVEMWNKHQFIDQVIQVNIPEVWVFGSGDEWEGLKALQEPFIEGYQKFNSNTGWNIDPRDETAWSQVMQALSHFTYHISNGEYLLCDLQGGIYNNSVILTDPVILSKAKRYGTTDLGPQGISSFFSNHRCNYYCRQHWKKPQDRNRYHDVQAGTSMAGVTATDNNNRYNNGNNGNMRPPANNNNNNRMMMPPAPRAMMIRPPNHNNNHNNNHNMRSYNNNKFFSGSQRVAAVNERNYDNWN